MIYTMQAMQVIEQAARRILDAQPDATVRIRLLRDVLRRAARDESVLDAKQDVLKSRWVRELAHEQRGDGSWGRLHSRDSRAKAHIVTTEVGVERALALGLDATGPVLRNAGRYLANLLQGKAACPDPPERNDRWTAGVRLFAAATLARIQPDHPALDDVWNLWAAIASRTFAAGGYDADREIAAHRELTGASVRDSYLVLCNKYALTLLGARAAQIPPAVERALVNWVWRKPDGIGYLSVPLSQPPKLSASVLDRWFTSMELLSCFPRWRRVAQDAIERLWTERNEQELWDFGPRWPASAALPLSDSWRDARHRQMDHSTRTIVLLRRYYDSP